MVHGRTAAGATVEAIVPVSPAVEPVVAMVAAVETVIPAGGAAIAVTVIAAVKSRVMPNGAARVRAPVRAVPAIITAGRLARRTGVTVAASRVRAPGIMADRRLHARIDPAHDWRGATATLFARRGAAVGFARIASATIPATRRSGEVTSRLVAARSAIAPITAVAPVAPVAAITGAVGVPVSAGLAAIEVGALSAAIAAAAPVSPVATITAIRSILSLRLDGRDIQQGRRDQKHGSSGAKQAKFSDCHRTRLRGLHRAGPGKIAPRLVRRR